MRRGTFFFFFSLDTLIPKNLPPLTGLLGAYLPNHSLIHFRSKPPDRQNRLKLLPPQRLNAKGSKALHQFYSEVSVDIHSNDLAINKLTFTYNIIEDTQKGNPFHLFEDIMSSQVPKATNCRGGITVITTLFFLWTAKIFCNSPQSRLAHSVSTLPSLCPAKKNTFKRRTKGKDSIKERRENGCKPHLPK
ncbi:hypothetical protein CEXT_641811 [Caerostris extrusa]|uniref:Uncharacterized protein n=1 Tax=Caerostris extrusa TaxID=172846 RepID=A0AAV4PCU0_CAEEX|nr:hypothetical protein CEXT_641811 [Caerostris extrusa]